MLDVIERAEKSKERAQTEYRRVVREQDAKDIALRKVKEAEEKGVNLTKDLSVRDEEI